MCHDCLFSGVIIHLFKELYSWTDDSSAINIYTSTDTDIKWSKYRNIANMLAVRPHLYMYPLFVFTSTVVLVLVQTALFLILGKVKRESLVPKMDLWKRCPYMDFLPKRGVLTFPAAFQQYYESSSTHSPCAPNGAQTGNGWVYLWHHFLGTKWLFCSL